MGDQNVDSDTKEGPARNLAKEEAITQRCDIVKSAGQSGVLSEIRCTK